jgi:hypothetical protein
MATKVQVVLDEEEREELRRAARRAGTSLSAWLREAGRARLAREESALGLDSLEDLDAFFAECDRREGQGREPDWPQHREVIAASRGSGAAST